MAFQNKNLSVLAYAQGFTLWHYKTQDPMIDVNTPGYFNNILTICDTGDIVIINAFDGTYIASFTLKSGSVILTKVHI